MAYNLPHDGNDIKIVYTDGSSAFAEVAIVKRKRNASMVVTDDGNIFTTTNGVEFTDKNGNACHITVVDEFCVSPETIAMVAPVLQTLISAARAHTGEPKVRFDLPFDGQTLRVLIGPKVVRTKSTDSESDKA